MQAICQINCQQLCPEKDTIGFSNKPYRFSTELFTHSQRKILRERERERNTVKMAKYAQLSSSWHSPGHAQ